MAINWLSAVANDWTSHAPRSTAATSEFAARDGDDLDALLSQHGVGRDVTFVAHNDARSHGEEVCAVVPLLSLGRSKVFVSGQYRDRLDFENRGERPPEIVILRDVQFLRLPPCGDRPTAEMTIEVGVEDERGDVDHGHHRVEVHEGVAVWKFNSHYLRSLTAHEQSVRDHLDRHRRRAFAHTDQDGAMADDVNVATFDRSRLIRAIFAPVVRNEVRTGELWVKFVDGPRVESFALARGHGHRVDRDTP